MRAGGVFACAAAMALLASPASAICFARDASKPGGWDLDRSGPARTFSVDDEFGRAFIVAKVHVIGAATHMNADGLIADHTYRVVPQDTFKGPPLAEFTLFNANNSARFDMEAGKSYLVFASASGGRSVIDSCGWSDPLPAATETLSKVRDIAATTRPPSSP